MKYSVQLRMNSMGESKFLIDSWGGMDFMTAFHKAKDVAAKLEEDHFVEIVQEDCHEIVARFN